MPIIVINIAIQIKSQVGQSEQLPCHGNCSLPLSGTAFRSTWSQPCVRV